MKRALVIIRTCLRDDFLSLMCYGSFKHLKLDADYIFFCESSQYKWINQLGVTMLYRSNCDNFGGRTNVIPYLKDLKLINTDGYEYVLVADADLIMNKNPLDEGFSFGGIRDDNNNRHYSGQLLIFKKELFDTIVSFDDFVSTIDEMIKKEINIADDTVISYVATGITDDVRVFNELNYWEHTKMYHLEPI